MSNITKSLTWDTEISESDGQPKAPLQSFKTPTSKPVSSMDESRAKSSQSFMCQHGCGCQTYGGVYKMSADSLIYTAAGIESESRGQVTTEPSGLLARTKSRSDAQSQSELSTQSHLKAKSSTGLADAESVWFCKTCYQGLCSSGPIRTQLSILPAPVGTVTISGQGESSTILLKTKKADEDLKQALANERAVEASRDRYTNAIGYYSSGGASRGGF